MLLKTNGKEEEKETKIAAAKQKHFDAFLRLREERKKIKRRKRNFVLKKEYKILGLKKKKKEKQETEILEFNDNDKDDKFFCFESKIKENKLFVH